MTTCKECGRLVGTPGPCERCARLRWARRWEVAKRVARSVGPLVLSAALFIITRGRAKSRV